MRRRHDGFTPAKRKLFLETLRETGCVRDGCRVAKISKTSIDRWRNKDDDFAKQCEQALALAAVNLETLAYERATVGAREVVIRDGKVTAEKIRPSNAILRTLMQGAAPERYGRSGAAARGPKLTKAELEKLRKEIETELRPRIREEIAHEVDDDEIELVRRRILRKLGTVQDRSIEKDGWVRDECGCMIPPGWVREDGSGRPSWPRRERPEDAALEAKIDAREAQLAREKLAAGWTRQDGYWVPPGFVKAAGDGGAEAGGEAD